MNVEIEHKETLKSKEKIENMLRKVEASVTTLNDFEDIDNFNMLENLVSDLNNLVIK